MHSTAGSNFGKGYGLGATVKYAGLTAGAYGTERETETQQLDN